ncbi:MAG TPA: hypothetical protein VJN62_10705 [Gemmatimonadales bacterium]|nr:hypothetical protein [Gemmatimonadales bacterium]
MKPLRSLFAARRFWLIMPYRCTRCGILMDFYLEDGCEGPTGGGEEMFRLPANHPFRPGELQPWAKTPSGRLIVPVPFVAGGCPICQGKPPWSFGRDAGCLQHSGVDRRLDGMMEQLARGTARFNYPKDPRADQACGIPIFPPFSMRGER